MGQLITEQAASPVTEPLHGLSLEGSGAVAGELEHLGHNLHLAQLQLEPAY